MVTERDAGGEQLVTAREQTTETRLKANVIRRRTAREVLKREEMPTPPPSDAPVEIPPSLDASDEVPPALEEAAPPPPPAPAPEPEHVEVPVAYPVLVMGGRVEVPALVGEPVTLEVPAGTASGGVLRVRGRGLPSLRGGHGDLLAHVSVWIPGRVSAPERKLLEELRRLAEGRVPKPGRTVLERVRDAFAF